MKEDLEAFVRLSVDARYREEALAGSGGPADSFRSLEEEICRQARSLVNKRLGVVKRILGGSARALGPAFDEEFRAYASGAEEPRGVNRHRLDALAFARWLAAGTREGRFPRALRDLLAHESAPPLMWIEGRGFLLRVHRCSPAAILRALEAGKGLPDRCFRPAVVVWRRGSRAGEGFRWREYAL